MKQGDSIKLVVAALLLIAAAILLALYFGVFGSAEPATLQIDPARPPPAGPVALPGPTPAAP